MKFDLSYIILVFFTVLLYGCSAKTNEIDGPDAVSELTSVDIGGIEQWLLMRGKDVSNPVLLWLHGGPGAAQMPIHHAFTEELEQEYIVVHWDQRGSGKSNPAGFDEEAMTFERYLKDVEEVTQHLLERFQKRKIYLLGHSWGTQLGIRSVNRTPEYYHAFISVSQVVHSEKAEKISYEWLKGRVRSSGTEVQMQKFAELGTPPYKDHDRYVAFAKMKDEFGGGMDEDILTLLKYALQAPEYTIFDYIRWFDGANRGSGPMWEETRDVDLFSEVPELDLPVWFIVGENDYNTPAELVEEYYKYVYAPEGKHLIVMEDCSHAPFIGNPDRFNREIIQIKNALLSK
ncbi:MAG TPA: alpha/beta hydrolase [Balneolaceae bacterium]|nr:alpha/beta hydrolase [Balneolaceae bacterium]